jgi:hypothetical protein
LLEERRAVQELWQTVLGETPQTAESQ